MPRPTELRTCHVQKNVLEAVVVSTPVGPATAQPGDYIVTDNDSTQWVFTEAQLKVIAGVKPLDPHPLPSPPPPQT